MAANLTTTSQVDDAVGVFYDRILARAVPEYIYERFGQERQIPKGRSDTIKWRRYTALSAATTPLAEGITPPGSQLAKTDLTAKVSQYGDYVHVTDWVDLTVEDPVLTETAVLENEQLMLTRDTLCRNIMVACASNTNASNGSNGQSPTEIAQTDVDNVVIALLGGNAKPITKVVTAGSGQGTAPIPGAFMGLCHTDLLTSLEACVKFKYVHEYPQQNAAMVAEWGSTGHVRWLYSSNGDRTLGTPDSYKNIIVGQESYGIVSIAGSQITSIVKGFNAGDKSDPLNQRTTMGWKMTYVARILNDAFMHKLTSTNKAGS